MNENLGQQPAFPRPIGPYVEIGGGKCTPQFGMSYRQWLVGVALQGILANSDMTSDAAKYSEISKEDIANVIARAARKHADAVLAELEKTNP